MRFNLMQKAAFCALKNSENLYRTIQGCKHSLPKVHGFLLVGTDLIHDQQTYPGTGRQGGTSRALNRAAIDAWSFCAPQQKSRLSAHGESRIPTRNK